MDIENKIIKRFDELSHIFPEEISLDDSRAKEVLKFVGEPSNKKILDLGCGKGRFCRKIKDLGFKNIIGVDPSKELIKSARENNKDIEFVQASCTDLPFKDKEFDALICVEVLEHIPDLERAIKEIERVLKPTGRMLIIDKNVLSLHPSYFIPTFLWKKFLESRNKWFYPKNFYFKEKYFTPLELNKILRKYFSDTKIRFIRYKIVNRNQPSFIRYIFRIHNVVSLIFYKIFPFLSLFIVWEGTKK